MDEARQLAAERGLRLLGVVAEAPHLPLRDQSMNFVFDRGCMHLFPVADWPAHVAEMARILQPGGFAQLVEHTLTPTLVGGLLPPQVEAVRVETFEFRLRNRRSLWMTNALLRRTA